MSRSAAREVAMKIGYSRLVGGQGTPDLVIEESEIQDKMTEEDVLFAREVSDGVEEHREELDAVIEKHAIGWSLERISKVDLAILRVAVYEILYREDVPAGAAINEAVELAKRFGGDHSYSFINGILGAFAKEKGFKK